ncbi:MAG: undecaprenyl-diphosphate phosphatase [Eubacteriales bacterium]
MSIIFAVIYGLVQGITEFLPVSSSGHLSLIQSFFSIPNVEADYFSFDILLHLATLAAVVIVYARDIGALIVSFFSLVGKLFHGKFKLSDYTDSERFVIMVVIATLPLIPAVLLNDKIEALYAIPKLIGAILIFNGVMLFVSDSLSHGHKQIGDMKPRNAVITGLCQMCALLPGLSRSGSTITGSLAQGFDRAFAVKFSFILSIPAILGANIIKIPDLISSPVPAGDITAYICGMAAALISGICAMKLLIYISKKSNFKIFGIYCIIIGIISVIFA